MLTRVKGTQDILDTTLRNFFLATLREHLSHYNFSEIITPLLEKKELFQRAAGAETDIVTKEMYTVTSTNERESLCLRPEITASIMRAFLENGMQAQAPWQVFTYGPVFRHERPQKGRYREFYQASLEIIGSSSPTRDAYFITLLDRFFHEKLHLDTYALMLNFLGCPSDRLAYKETLRAFLEEHESVLCTLCRERKSRNILRIMDCKEPSCQELYRKVPDITDVLCAACKAEWQLIQHLLQELSVSFTRTPHLVRGLDYYSKIVFEFVAVHTLGAQATFCGGGRYDTLASLIGASQDYPSIGAAIGIERVLLMLEEIKDKLPLPAKPPLHLIVPLSQEQYPLALQVADELHAQGLTADIFLEGGSLKSMLRKADTRHALTASLIGTEEQQSHTVTLKQMREGTEARIPQTELVAYLLKVQAS
jgi:histidyl-tRNA synthetase